MEPQQTANKGKNIGIGIGIIAVLTIIAVSVFGAKKNSSADSEQTTTDTTTQAIPDTTVADTTSTKKASVYKDGTYTATGSYMSPGGPDQLGVTLTLKDDIVTAVSVQTKPGDKTSAHYQGIFAANYTSLVVGKNIASVHLDKVSGSSLTSGGFNDALKQIEVQAKA